ncbi:PAS domain S-box protein [Paraconexibacter antarcticus]|uniref:PAS domain S-box protein n=1 Tax=Paraconexibacter antarcticus TaxID=2949664 RepID=A0ABY5DYD2_9ACTN|nr:PAS domain S-box protein [Paraconexibacter antarcticus]UTI65574.1 PAS domain S-box protein [Paraconexibacter antarcticus]
MGQGRTSFRSLPKGTGDAPGTTRAPAGISLGLLEHAPDAIVGLDAAGQVRLANAAAEALFGYDRAALLTMALADLVPGADGDPAEWCAVRADGTQVPVELSRTPLPTDDGELTVCILHDTTERRRVEAELRASRRRLAEAEQLARVGSWEWDIPANAVEWSDQLFRIYGLEPQSITPSYDKFLAYVHPDDRADVDARNHKAFADHEPFEDVKRVIREDGREILMRTQGEVVCDAGGAPIRMIGVCEDVTAQESAARTLSTLASIVQSSGDAIYAVDHHGLLVSWNPAAEALFGYPEADVLGRTTRLLMPENLAEHDRAAVERVLAGDAIQRFETERRHRDGSHVEVALTISPIVGADAMIAGASIIARDISERRRLEEQVRHLADHDALTGLMNGRRFDEKLAERVADAVGYRLGGAVLVVDIDGFKEINRCIHSGRG